MLLRLELLAVVRSERVFRDMGATLARRQVVSEAARGCDGALTGLDESEELLLAAGDAERGDLSSETGDESMRVKEGRMSSGVRGVEGVP